MPTGTPVVSVVETLTENRGKLFEELETRFNSVLEERDLDEDEAREFAQLEDDIRKLDERIAKLSGMEARKAESEKNALPRVNVKSESLTYQRNNGTSYFTDLLRAETLADPDARERLMQHAAEMRVEMPKREARRAERADQEMRSISDFESPFERRVNPNTSDGQGGYFVPPVWLIDEFVPYARAGRPFANSVRNLTLPEGTNSINLPRLATGTAVGSQTEAGSVTSTDFTDNSVTATVYTKAGQQDISLQLLEQSPINMADEVIIVDLMADYNQKVDNVCLNGTGSGEPTGIDVLSGTNTVTYTDASPTGPEMYPAFGQGLSQIATNRHLPGNLFILHPRRLYWLSTQTDTNGRPLVVPKDTPQFNSTGQSNVGGIAEGPWGTILGTPTIMDASVTTTDSSTRDRGYAVKADDLLLWEGSVRTRVLQEVLSGTLQVRIQLYNYIAFMPDRYAKAISVMSGTGFAAPSGF